jgi:glucose/arabinose dehydrogenase
MLKVIRIGIAILLPAAFLSACSDELDRSGSGGISSETAQSPAESPTDEIEKDNGADQEGPDRPSIADIRIRLKPIAAGFDSPLLVTNAGDGSGRLFVVEQGGRVKIVRNGRVAPQPFLDISGLVTAGGEQGLLGLAFHPDYPSNGRFYVNYTDTGGDHVIAEYRTSSDPDRADGSSERVLLQVDDPFSNHNGGHLAFGDDGYLYVAMGDGGSGGDPLESGQSLDTLLGKILRIDVGPSPGGRPYSIPRDNPFIDRDGARPEVWAFGLRNPWRFSFDEGDLWIGDVGQDGLEEIDRMPADRAGLNYGWNTMEGDACYDPPTGCDRKGLVLPIATYTHDLGCSVTGGYVYRGQRFDSLSGAYFFSDYCSGFIWALDAAGGTTRRPRVVLESDHSVSSFGLDEAGEIYLTDIASGEVLQVIEAG